MNIISFICKLPFPHTEVHRLLSDDSQPRLMAHNSYQAPKHKLHEYIHDTQMINETNSSSFDPHSPCIDFRVRRNVPESSFTQIINDVLRLCNNIHQIIYLWEMRNLSSSAYNKLEPLSSLHLWRCCDASCILCEMQALDSRRDEEQNNWGGPFINHVQ